MCTHGDALLDPERYRSLKISVLHGELDEMVSSELSRRMVDQCRELLLEGLREARCVDVNKDSTSLIALQEVLQNIKVSPLFASECDSIVVPFNTGGNPFVYCCGSFSPKRCLRDIV